MGTTTHRRSMKHFQLIPSVKHQMGFGLAFALFLVILAACSGSLVEPFAGENAPVGGDPAGGQPSPAPPSPAPPPTPPPISPSGYPTYVRVSSGIASGARERYVFYDDSSFAMHYAPPPGWDWTYEVGGSYTKTESRISFRWDLTGEWTATGTVRGDSLIVQYNQEMLWADFVDGVYVLDSNGSP